MILPPLRVAALGMGWWSDVLADADKIGAASRFVVLRAPEIAGLITDAPRGSQALALLAEGGLPITYATTR